jgi:hypothetical protein
MKSSHSVKLNTPPSRTEAEKAYGFMSTHHGAAFNNHCDHFTLLSVQNVRQTWSYSWSIRGSPVSIATKLWVEWSEVQIPGQAREFSPFQNSQPPSQCYRDSFPGVKRPGVKLTTDLHLVPMLRMSAAVPVLPVIYLHGMDHFKVTHRPKLRRLIERQGCRPRCQWQIPCSSCFIPCERSLCNHYTRICSLTWEVGFWRWWLGILLDSGM